MKINVYRYLSTLIRITSLALILVMLSGVFNQWTIPANAQALPCSRDHLDVATPLNDLGNQVYIRMDGTDTGFSGGLYPDGSNTRPPAHEAAGLEVANQIARLDADGNPDQLSGKIVMVSIGMSNTAAEFNEFISVAEADPELNPNLVLVNGAQPGMVSGEWVDPNAITWDNLDASLAAKSVTPLQVQVAWIKLTRVGYGDFPERALALQADLKKIVQNLQTNYPNIKLAFLSSRTRSFTYWLGLSPEPTAFETGFSVKWLIDEQINGHSDLNYDPSQGPVVAPYLSWGPYLWADGINPRSDGLVWLQEDMARDCTHPSDLGKAKVAEMLLGFFEGDTITGWFSDAPVVEHNFYLPYVIAESSAAINFNGPIFPSMIEHFAAGGR